MWMFSRTRCVPDLEKYVGAKIIMDKSHAKLTVASCMWNVPEHSNWPWHAMMRFRTGSVVVRVWVN